MSPRRSGSKPPAGGRSNAANKQAARATGEAARGTGQQSRATKDRGKSVPLKVPKRAPTIKDRLDLQMRRLQQAGYTSVKLTVVEGPNGRVEYRLGLDRPGWEQPVIATATGPSPWKIERFARRMFQHALTSRNPDSISVPSSGRLVELSAGMRYELRMGNLMTPVHVDLDQVFDDSVGQPASAAPTPPPKPRRPQAKRPPKRRPPKRQPPPESTPAPAQQAEQAHQSEPGTTGPASEAPSPGQPASPEMAPAPPPEPRPAPPPEPEPADPGIGIEDYQQWSTALDSEMNDALGKATSLEDIPDAVRRHDRERQQIIGKMIASLDEHSPDADYRTVVSEIVKQQSLPTSDPTQGQAAFVKMQEKYRTKVEQTAETTPPSQPGKPNTVLMGQIGTYMELGGEAKDLGGIVEREVGASEQERAAATPITDEQRGIATESSGTSGVIEVV